MAASRVFCRRAKFTMAIRSVCSSVRISSTYAFVDVEAGSR